jgi:hypothetical protein
VRFLSLGGFQTISQLRNGSVSADESQCDLQEVSQDYDTEVEHILRDAATRLQTFGERLHTQRLDTRLQHKIEVGFLTFRNSGCRCCRCHTRRWPRIVRSFLGLCSRKCERNVRLPTEPPWRLWSQRSKPSRTGTLSCRPHRMPEAELWSCRCPENSRVRPPFRSLFCEVL